MTVAHEEPLPPKPPGDPAPRPPLDLVGLWAQVVLLSKYLHREVWNKKKEPEK